MKSVTLDDIKLALDSDRFCFYYQPQVSLLSGELIGAEALIRWINDDGNIIYPNEFIPIAEEYDYITEITFKMFDKFVSDLSVISNLNNDIKLSINFSAKDIVNDRLLKKIKRYIDSQIISTDSFSIEITETSYIHELDQYRLSNIENLNIELIMDDYGTGFSNLISLINTPFKKLKLDRAIINGLGKSVKNEIIITETIKLSHRLGLEVVAEGVENDREYRYLQENGCSIAQGYLISKPIELSEFISSFILNKKKWDGSVLGLIRMAQLDHIQWRNDIINDAFKNFCDKNSPIISCITEIKDHKCCSFGQWYYSDGVKYLYSNEDFNRIEKEHKELHKIGIILINKSKNHNIAIDDIIFWSKKLTKQSFILLESINNLESSILISKC